MSEVDKIIRVLGDERYVLLRKQRYQSQPLTKLHLYSQTNFKHWMMGSIVRYKKLKDDSVPLCGTPVKVDRMHNRFQHIRRSLRSLDDDNEIVYGTMSYGICQKCHKIIVNNPDKYNYKFAGEARNKGKVYYLYIYNS
jgi:hypothetical protein